MKLDRLAEGLVDYAIEREERDARENWISWASEVASGPCDEDDCGDCGWCAYARAQLTKANRRARGAGVFDDQPGEAGWLTMHRRERDGDRGEDR